MSSLDLLTSYPHVRTLTTPLAGLLHWFAYGLVWLPGGTQLSHAVLTHFSFPFGRSLVLLRLFFILLCKLAHALLLPFGRH